MSKVCAACGEELEDAEFYRDRGSVSGLASHCKRCQNKVTRLRRERDLAARRFKPLPKDLRALAREVRRRAAVVRKETEREEERCGKRDSRAEY